LFYLFLLPGYQRKE